LHTATERRFFSNRFQYFKQTYQISNYQQEDTKGYELDTSFVGKSHHWDPRRLYSQTGADWQYRIDQARGFLCYGAYGRSHAVRGLRELDSIHPLQII